jgi:hypothetical protein
MPAERWPVTNVPPVETGGTDSIVGWSEWFLCMSSPANSWIGILLYGLVEAGPCRRWRA